jgi:hypothetical protein
LSQIWDDQAAAVQYLSSAADTNTITSIATCRSMAM